MGHEGQMTAAHIPFPAGGPRGRGVARSLSQCNNRFQQMLKRLYLVKEEALERDEAAWPVGCLTGSS
jgi:hypothetical protein